MANKRLPLRKIKEVLRLKYICGLGEREIAQSCRVSRTTVGNYLKNAEAAGLNWPVVAGLSEAQLESRLFHWGNSPSDPQRPLPDCQYIYDQLRDHKKVNLTLTQLWLEYKEQHPDGYQYTQFCEYYHRWRGKLDYCMRQEHRAGEKVFIDYCDGLSIVDPATGELTLTQLFVAVWGASNYTYAEATLSQKLADWIGSHVHAFEYFCSVPRMLVPDNLKSGVHDACFYEPELNPTYADMAQHYGCAVLPARPAKPRDKAKVEGGVLISQRWILAVLRQRTFYSLAELNASIRVCLERLNTRIMRRTGKSRRELFESMDHPARPAPTAEALRIRGMGQSRRQHRLPHRGRQPLLQRAFCPDSREARCTADRHHGRGFPQRRKGRRPCPVLCPRRLYHTQRTHAAGTPPLCRMEPLPFHQVGGPDGNGHG